MFVSAFANTYNQRAPFSGSSYSIGVIFFNFILLNEVINGHAFLTFFMQLGLETIIAFIATLFLAFLLAKIEHHIKFVPIIFLIILIYAISKELHLPALLFILIFGLFLQFV